MNNAVNNAMDSVQRSEFILRSQKSLAKLIARTSIPWTEMVQPVPLATVEGIIQDNGSIRYICTGITKEATAILSQLPAPLHIVAFTGFGRTGKSHTASMMRQYFGKDEELVEGEPASFTSSPGNTPCTHGIDLMVFPHPDPAKGGNIVFLDCEGGGNHNQSALPFVIGLAARLSSMLYVFERGCFTTNGLDTVMQIINMGGATSKSKGSPDITRHLVLCENMSMNATIPSNQLKADLLSEYSGGDDATNKIRSLVKQKFDVEFFKIPYYIPGNSAQNTLYSESIKQLAISMSETVQPFNIAGDIQADGASLLTLAHSLLSQVKTGGNRYNVVSATEALVANMASEAAHTQWIDFIHKTRRAHLHPTQVTGRKHLRTITREVEGISNMCLVELECFIGKLYPREPAEVGILIWEQNLRDFMGEVREAHERKASNIARYTVWTARLNSLVTDIIQQVIGAIGQFAKFARFSTSLILMSNYYLWKRSLSVLWDLSGSLI